MPPALPGRCASLRDVAAFQSTLIRPEAPSSPFKAMRYAPTTSASNGTGPDVDASHSNQTDGPPGFRAWSRTRPWPKHPGCPSRVVPWGNPRRPFRARVASLHSRAVALAARLLGSRPVCRRSMRTASRSAWKPCGARRRSGRVRRAARHLRRCGVLDVAADPSYNASPECAGASSGWFESNRPNRATSAPRGQRKARPVPRSVPLARYPTRRPRPNHQIRHSPAADREGIP